MLNRFRLRTRIGLLVIAGLLVIFASMAFFGAQAVARATDSLLQERLRLATTAADELDRALNARLRALQRLTSHPVASLDDESLQNAIAGLQSVYNFDRFAAILITDDQGQVIWMQPENEAWLGKPLPCEALGQVLRTGKAGFGCVHDGLIENTPAILLVAPILNHEGDVIGALSGVVDPHSELIRHVVDFTPPGRTTYTHLVDAEGLDLAHSNTALQFRRNEHADLMQQLIIEGQATIAWSETHKGEREVIAFAPLAVAPWGVAIEQEAAELLLPLERLSQQVLLFAVAASVLAIALVSITTQSVTRPLHRLLYATERLTHGDLSEPVFVEGQDELAELAQAVETLRQRLAEREATLAAWGERLEETVAQRTRELQALYAIDHAAAQSLELGEVLHQALQASQEVTQASGGAIYLLNPLGERLSMRVSRGVLTTMPPTIHLEQDADWLPVQAIRAGRTVFQGREDRLPLQSSTLNEAATPLLSGGRTVGVMVLTWERPRSLSDEERALLTALGAQIGGAVHRAQLFWSVQQRLAEMRLLFAVVESTRAAETPVLLAETLVNHAMLAVEADCCTLWLLEQRELHCLAARGACVVQAGQRRKPKGALAAVLESGLPVLQPQGILLPLTTSGGVIGVMELRYTRPRTFTKEEQALLTAIADIGANALQRALLLDDLRTLSVDVVRALAAAIDARDPYTRGHSESVARYAVAIGRAMGLDGEAVQRLEFAGLLHDTGKLAVPDAILRKPAPLTPIEREAIRRHPFYSAQIVHQVHALRPIEPWVYHHHERWDGNGYPARLKGEDIPLGARIIAVADTFDAMTSDRPYRKALPVEVALAEIRENAGKQFDPHIADVFLNLPEFQGKGPESSSPTSR